MVPYLRLPELRDVPAVIDLVDVDSQKWLDYAAASRGPRRLLYRLESRRLRRLELGLPSWARAITLVSEAEANLYRSFGAGGIVRAVPNGIDLEYYHPRTGPSEPSCVFVGALDYRPNVDGACWFCEEILPAIRRCRPDAKVYLVGRQPVPQVRRLADLPGVDVVGQVPDVRPYVARAAVTVVPLRIARGLQNKVLEALAMGRPVVATPAALQGLEAKDGIHLLAAQSPTEWVDTVLRLLADPTLGQELGSAGRHYAETYHRWDRCLEPFSALLGLRTEDAAGKPFALPDALAGSGPAVAVGQQH
jgi:sugar transferase (PEP-CTERM/EpsH1 system associated)